MAKASQTTTKSTKTSVTIKAKDDAPSGMERCHVCGEGFVPKSWYSSTKSKSKKK